MDDRFENFTVTVLKLGKLVQKIKLFEMESYGLKAIHVMCIYFAGLAPVTAVELCRLTSEDKAAISRALSLLKQKGYITYPAGAYNAEISLTEEGRKLCEFINVRATAAADFAGKGYGDFKLAVGEAVADKLAPIQAEQARLLSDKAYLDNVLASGAEKAYRTAKKTLAKVYKKIGFYQL